MKKLMAALLAVAMVCAMAIPAFAAAGTEVSGSKVDITNHDFEAYQIFSAKLDSTKDTLSDVKWGNGVKDTELLAALQGTTDFSTCSSASDVAEKLEAFSTEQATRFAAFVANGYLSTTKIAGTGTIDLPSAGYYLIKDVTEVDGEYDASNLTLLLVSGPKTVTPKVKTDIPTQNIVPPAPVREIIDLSGAANPLQQAVWESYNPFDDDLRLRKSPETFEMQRGLYPLRREFPAYYIKGIPPTGSPILENLGFHLV